eukprot:Selendium_serpulae@DN4798_c0_g2_i1.p1
MVKQRKEILQMKIRQYHIVGRAAPTVKLPEPKTYRMRLFAKNEVLAKSKFWYFMKRMCKSKKSGGEILKVNEIREKDPERVKIFSIWLRYDSRTGTHNMYKEYRAMSQNSAVSQMYSEMAGRHRALSQSIQIMRISEIEPENAKRAHITQLLDPKLKFPALLNLPMLPNNQRSPIIPKRPCVFDG